MLEWEGILTDLGSACACSDFPVIEEEAKKMVERIEVEIGGEAFVVV